MAVDVIMPQMGESIQEGTLVKWLKKPGDKVARDEPLFEISTDKVDAEIPSPAAGVLGEVKVKEGETVAIKTVVAVIEPEGSASAAAGREAGKEPAGKDSRTVTVGPPEVTQSEKPVPQADGAADSTQGGSAIKTESAGAPSREPSGQGKGPSSPAEGARPAGAGAPSPGAAPRAASPDTPARERGATVTSLEERLRTRSSPVVRKIAAEHGIEISELSGSGISGRVTKKDILGYIETQPATAAVGGGTVVEMPRIVPAYGPGERFERVPMTAMRKRIAEHMVASRRASAHVTTFFEIDMTRIAKIRAAKKEAFLDRHGVNLTYMPFIMKATVDSLLAYAAMNASIEGTDVLYKKDVNLGVAVALDWGLIVPVVKNAQDLSLSGLAKAVTDLATRARNKQLKPEEVQGGTFTITNPGVFGSLFGTPIINQPQVAILGVGTIEKRPVVIDDAIAIRTMAYFAISFDHRLIDGAVADQFMAQLKKTLQEFDESVV